MVLIEKPENVPLVIHNYNDNFIQLGPVVQSVVSLTKSLKGQLVKCITTL